MKITLNISPQKFGELTEDIELGVEFGYHCEVYNALRELMASASERDQDLAARGMLGKYPWLHKQQRMQKQAL